MEVEELPNWKLKAQISFGSRDRIGLVVAAITATRLRTRSHNFYTLVVIVSCFSHSYFTHNRPAPTPSIVVSLAYRASRFNSSSIQPTFAPKVASGNLVSGK